MTLIRENQRKVQIAIHRRYWFNELMTGTEIEEVNIELLICEEKEDYEQCEGIKQAKKHYLETLKKLNERT